jgi:hypothetical protein
MICEQVVLDERMDATAQEVEDLARQFFLDNITIPLAMDMTFEQDGDKQIWVIKPGDPYYSGLDKVINGYFEISSVSLDRNRKPVNVRIVSHRSELTALWLDLVQYIKVGLLIPGYPPSYFVTPLSKQIVLVEGIPISDVGSMNNSSSKIEDEIQSPILPNPDDIVKKYGKYRNLTKSQVRQHVKQCRDYQRKGLTLMDYYASLDSGYQFSIETLRSWTKNPDFRPK